MIILAEHTVKGKMTFQSNIFNNVKELDPRWKIIDANYKKKKQEIKVVKIEKKELKKIIIKKFNTKIYTVKSFSEQIKKFTQNELKEFAKDDRKTISKLAKKYLK